MGSSALIFLVVFSVGLSAHAPRVLAQSQSACTGGKVYDSCGSPCLSALTCETYETRDSIACAAVCVEGCFCPQGTVDHNGVCIDPSDCPATNQDGCAVIFCPAYTSCHTNRVTGESACYPDCQVSNGGCQDDQVCRVELRRAEEDNDGEEESDDDSSESDEGDSDSDRGGDSHGGHHDGHGRHGHDHSSHHRHGHHHDSHRRHEHHHSGHRRHGHNRGGHDRDGHGHRDESGHSGHDRHFIDFSLSPDNYYISCSAAEQLGDGDEDEHRFWRRSFTKISLMVAVAGLLLLVVVLAVCTLVICIKKRRQRAFRPQKLKVEAYILTPDEEMLEEKKQEL